ncbi:hypothetical protein GX563_09015 [Candidatus Bathyarchaeota archaeon]|nr:hypothetical protein [Candidatus Bathyarchaeota archaeon]
MDKKIIAVLTIVIVVICAIGGTVAYQALAPKAQPSATPTPEPTQSTPQPTVTPTATPAPSIETVSIQYRTTGIEYRNYDDGTFVSWVSIELMYDTTKLPNLSADNFTLVKPNGELFEIGSHGLGVNTVSGMNLTFGVVENITPSDYKLIYNGEYPDQTINLNLVRIADLEPPPSSVPTFIPTPNPTTSPTSTPTPSPTPTPTYLQLNVPYKASDNLTVTLTSLTVIETAGSYQYTITYTLKNENPDTKIDESTFKMYYKDGSGGLPQYGMFGSLFYNQTISRSYIFEELKTKPFGTLAYGPDVFFGSQPPSTALLWKVEIPSS